MKGRISLKDFILNIKQELKEIQTHDIEKAFFELKEVNLEVSFALDASAEGSSKFIVIDLKGSTKATQTHKVSIKLDPIKRPIKKSNINTTEKTKSTVAEKKRTPSVEFNGSPFVIEEEPIDNDVGPLIQADDPQKKNIL